LSNWGLYLQELEHLKALAIIMTLVVFLTVVMTFVLLKRVIEALSITKVH
jgi:type II secretory pathway component PulC